jgi:hypothetical protein
MGSFLRQSRLKGSVRMPSRAAGLVPEAEDAARLALGQPMTFESLGEGLRSFKGRAVCDLIHYRSQNT